MSVDWSMVGLFSIFPVMAFLTGLLLIFLTRHDGQPPRDR